MLGLDYLGFGESRLLLLCIVGVTNKWFTNGFSAKGTQEAPSTCSHARAQRPVTVYGSLICVFIYIYIYTIYIYSILAPTVGRVYFDQDR